MSGAGASSLAACEASSSPSAGMVSLVEPAERLQGLLGRGKVPNYVKVLVDILLETRAEIKELSRRNADLMEEVRLLREENLALKQNTSSVSKSVVDPSPNGSPNAVLSMEPDIERKRSIVLSNIPESSAQSPSERVGHDIACVNQILDFLNIECNPMTVYRMGKLDARRPRLMKVVLPASRFQMEAVRRAPRLRFSPSHRGVYLRPSLTKEERERRRGERLSSRRLGTDDTAANIPSQSVLQSPTPTQGTTPSSSSPSGNC